MEDAIATELVEASHKRDQVGRRITPAPEREALVAAYRQSGLTQRAFAQREGIKYSTLVSWLQGRRRAAGPTTGAPSEAVGFVEASLPGLLGGLEVRLADGTRVRGSSAREVAALVRALRA